MLICAAETLEDLRLHNTIVQITVAPANITRYLVPTIAIVLPTIGLTRERRCGCCAQGLVEGRDDSLSSVRTPVELRRSRLTLLENLGEGAFGTVQKALYAPSGTGMLSHDSRLLGHIIVAYI